MNRIPHIAVLLGTARTGRKSEHVARYIVDTLQKDARVDVVLYDVRDYVQERTIPTWQPGDETNATAPWRDVAKKADAFIMVLPEYNHGYPGEWKMVIDQAGPEYLGKPVMEVGVSTGPFMGARVIEHVRPVLVYLGLVNTNAPLYFGNVGNFVTADEVTRDAEYKEKIMKSLNILLAYESRLHGINADLQ